MSAEQVERYYDRSTRWFLLLGHGRKVQAIHRALWMPGVETLDEAMAQMHRLVEAQLEPELAGVNPSVLDLGCGVGGTIFDLAARRPDLNLTGVTLSGVQARAAQEAAEARGLVDRCRFHRGDFTDLAGLDVFDGAYALEAFIHGPDPSLFFEQVAQHVRPRGRLVICDDTLCRGTEGDGGIAGEREAVIERFVRGWRVGSLLELEEIQALAERTGWHLEDEQDLTEHIPLGRPRDRWIRTLVRPLRGRALPYRSEYLASLIGGDALQEALARRWVRFRMMTFVRRQAP